MKLISRALTLVLALVLLGCATPPPAPRPSTAEEWAALAIIGDDPMNTALRVTSGGPQDRWASPNIDLLQKKLVAEIDRRSGKTHLFVQVLTVHESPSWAFFSSATYIGSDGLARQASNFSRGAGRVVSCIAARCTYQEAALFQVLPEELELLLLAKRAGKIPHAFWNVRFAGSGLSVDLSFDFPEVEGFLLALKKAQRSLKQA